MWHIKKIDPADLVVDTQYIAFVGAGGKTSLIEYLAGETAKRNKKTAITTTTKIYAREPYMRQIIRYGSAKLLKTVSSHQ
jgi:probable selenium-dependent hydroxylase accessory protein YqeC